MLAFEEIKIKASVLQKSMSLQQESMEEPIYKINQIQE